MSKLFEVNLERFQGPYLKLLDLIEEKKLSINEFSLSNITDDYISFVKELEIIGEKSIIDISEFIIVASTLMLIKAKSLFPNINLNEEEKENIENLEKKLELFKIVYEASKKVNKIFEKKIFYQIAPLKNKDVFFVWDEQINTSLLHSIAIASLLKVPKKEKLKEVAVRQVLKIEDVIEKLLNRVNLAFSISFKDFSSSISKDVKTLEEKKSAFIVSFLAMLELIKNGVLEGEQNGNHNEINITKI